MILAGELLDLDRALKHARLFLWAASGTALFVFGWMLFTLDYKGKRGGVIDRQVELSLPYETIGSGPMALRPKKQAIILNLDQEIALLARNRRPDHQELRESKVLIGLKSSGQRRIAPSGTILYLRHDPEGGAKTLRFSEIPTSLWIRPILLDKNEVLIEVGREEKKKEEKVQFTLSEAPANRFAEMIQQGMDPAELRAFGELKKLKFWGKDLMVEKYGGKEIGSWKIEFAQPKYVKFVSVGDRLVYKGGRWEVAAPDEKTALLPVAYVKSVSSKGIELEGWDRTGFCPITVKSEIEKVERLTLKENELPHSLRIRGKTQAIGTLGKRKGIIRSGDWLLKTRLGWKSLRGSQEVQDYLHHNSTGELLIVESIERQEKKGMLKGVLFDRMRTQSTFVSIPIEIERKPPPVSKTTPKPPPPPPPRPPIQEGNS